MESMSVVSTLSVVHCWCGMQLAIPSTYLEHMNATGAICHCPLGHEFVFGTSVKEKLAEAEQRLADVREQQGATLDLLAAEERSHAATRGHLTRARKRTQMGQCPCCDKEFPDLQQHMKKEHPDYVKLGFA